MRIRVTRLALLIITVVLCSFLAVTTPSVHPQSSTAQVFFHASHPRGDLSIFRASNSEQFYDQVDMNFPVGPVTTVSLSAQIPGSSLVSLSSSTCPFTIASDLQSAYFGYVAWLLPIPANVQVDAPIQIDVWLSSSESPGMGGGYFFAIADVNPQNLHDNLCVLNSKASGGFEFNLGSSPQHYSTTGFGGSFKIYNHFFAAGRSLAFLAGAGAAKQGWSFKVYFDSPDNPSGALVPTSLIASRTVTTSTSQQFTSTTASGSTSASSGCSISILLTANPPNGPAPLTVVFNAAVSGANGAVQYDWWFGDGSHITGNPTMTYTYKNPWNYSVFVRVLDFSGCWSQAQTTVSVNSGAVPEFPGGSLFVILAAFVMLMVLKIKILNSNSHAARGSREVSGSG